MFAFSRPRTTHYLPSAPVRFTLGPVLLALGLLVIPLGSPSVSAQTLSPASFTASFSAPTPEPASSSLSAFAGLPDAPSERIGIVRSSPPRAVTHPRRPFSAFAIAFKASTNGLGIDLATPLIGRANLRIGGSLAKMNDTLTEDGLNVNGTLKLQGVITTLDLFPFRHSSFHISPGVNLSNDTHVTALLSVPANGSFSVRNGDYTSDPTNPITGYTRFTFGSRVAPRLTAGFGNMLSSRSHWSMPIEAGFQYISTPSVRLSMAGSACNSDGCGPIAGDPDIAIEQATLLNDVSSIRIFPVFSFGISYRLGRLIPVVF